MRDTKDPAGVGMARVVFDRTAFDDPDHCLTESVTLVLHRFAGWLIRRTPLTGAEFSHPRPAHALECDLHYGAPYTFDAPRTALVLDRAVPDQPVLQDEPGPSTFLRRAPADVLARLDYGSTAVARVGSRSYGRCRTVCHPRRISSRGSR
ncbi:AraC family transcriptional regulator [Streptomyces sp. NBC_00988]|uniref:AraC family transcriptional regulator ligand-binding domain-containing protein n=1 Tax=Streptomyces sp. NBC_00988 TaxID=2903704 RepID=UPI00386898EC|nr:AraC family transcriptional regulator [Streptomyces sp. NBC_00988]